MADASAPPLHVLVAEDNPVGQKVAAALLRSLGHEATVVADGDAAVAAWMTGRFDLVLMDVQMPVRDGLDAARMIRAAERDLARTRTPIVALTAGTQDGDHAACSNAGMDGVLPKPISAAVLAATIARQVPDHG